MTWSSRVQINVGDRVAVSARFLRQTVQHTGSICFVRGIVTELQPMGELTIALIAWDGAPPDVPERMNVKNLSKVTPERGVMDLD